MRNQRLLVIIFCFVLLLQFGFFSPSTESNQNQPALRAAPSASVLNDAPFSYVVVIVMENQGFCDIIPSVISQCGNSTVRPRLAPYMTALAGSNSSGLAENYTAITHPSLSNYLALLSGQDWGCAGSDVRPNSTPCTNKAWNSTNANLVDRLETSGLSWKAYMEDMPTNCDINGTGPGLYAARHDPFVYFKDIVDNPARCNKVVPAGVNDTSLLNDLESTSSASNFMWLTPNLCNDMHDDCTTNSTLPVTCDIGSAGNTTYCKRQGDTYLSQLVPRILNSTVFTTQRAALFLTFDEGNGYCPLNLNTSEDCIYTVWAGQNVIKNHFMSRNSYSHYSFLSTIDVAWNLPPLTINDTIAPPMSEFFTTLFPIRITSSPVSPEINKEAQFNATTSGGTGPYTYNWNFGDGPDAGNRTSHSYSSAGTYLVTVNATDARGATTISSQTIVVIKHPTVSFGLNPTIPVMGQEANLTAAVVDGEAPYVFSWDLGDGNFSTGNLAAHAYAVPGQFRVQVNVTDAQGFSSSYNQTIAVALRTSSIVLTCSPLTVMINETATCAATVHDASPGTTSIPTGSVSFTTSLTSGTFNLTSCTLVGGRCSASYVQTASTTAPEITANYAGDLVHATSSFTAPIGVTLRSTSTIISCPENGTVGATLSCLAKVSDTGSGSPSTPLGTVTLSSGDTCVLVAGSCSVDVLPSATGVWSILARYTPADSTHDFSSGATWSAIRTIPEAAINQPTRGSCLFSLCYPIIVWISAAVAAAAAVIMVAMLVFRGRLRRH